MAGLYVHVPFCTQRCIYCDFYFVTTRKDHRPFVDALCREIEYYASQYAGREPVETIYLGGGTPSLLSLDDLQRILQTIYDHYDCAHVRETTLELNPEDASHDYLEGLRALGFDRLSIGIQSFFQADLDFMSRAHDAEQAEAVVTMAQKAGFETFSIDLIFGLPDQDEEYWMANVAKAVRLGVPHLSTYSLTIEPKTVLHNRVQRDLVQPADEDVVAERYRWTIDYLLEQGFEHYEISSFARPGHRAVHNQVYWEHGNYLGFGPSAHSFWRGSLPEKTFRWSNIRHLGHYVGLLQERELPVDVREQLDLYDLADEHIMLRLRTVDGLDLDLLRDSYGVDLEYDSGEEIEWLLGEGFIEKTDDHRLRLTTKGKLVADSVTNKLLPDDD